MTKMIVSRLAQGIIVLIGITLLVFLATFLTGDPARLLMGDQATEAEVEAYRAKLGLDQPLMVQYGKFLKNAVRGDFGTSLYYREPCMGLVLDRLPNTLRLAGVSLVVSLVLSIPLGMLAAIKRNSFLDTGIMTVGLFGQAAPGFWLGIMLILIFSVKLKLLPVSGMMDGWRSYVLPGFALATWPLAQNIRMMRSSMIEVLGDDYIRTARAKGVSVPKVYFKHAFKNAIKPVITLIGMQMASFIGGAVIIENIFAWPGVGRLAVQAITMHDFPLLQTSVSILGLGFVVFNLLVDIAYMILDPRVR